MARIYWEVWRLTPVGLYDLSSLCLHYLIMFGMLFVNLGQKFNVKYLNYEG